MKIKNLFSKAIEGNNMTCKGCIKSGFCDLQMNNTTRGCPCKECLVKAMCTINICKEMNDVYFKIFNFNHEDYVI